MSTFKHQNLPCITSRVFLFSALRCSTPHPITRLDHSFPQMMKKMVLSAEINSLHFSQQQMKLFWEQIQYEFTKTTSFSSVSLSYVNWMCWIKRQLTPSQLVQLILHTRDAAHSHQRCCSFPPVTTCSLPGISTDESLSPQSCTSALSRMFILISSPAKLIKNRGYPFPPHLAPAPAFPTVSPLRSVSRKKLAILVSCLTQSYLLIHRCNPVFEYVLSSLLPTWRRLSMLLSLQD